MRGTARLHLGDGGGLEDIERSVELARSIGALELVSRHVNGLSVAHVVLGMFAPPAPRATSRAGSPSRSAPRPDTAGMRGPCATSTTVTATGTRRWLCATLFWRESTRASATT